MWLPNPQGLNLLDQTQYPLNPMHYASPQGVQFAQSQLNRLGYNPPLHMLQPTAGPYQMPGQATFGSVATATDGTPLGGLNAGAIADLYSRYGQATADAMTRAKAQPLGAALSDPWVQPSAQTPFTPQSVLGGVGGASPTTARVQPRVSAPASANVFPGVGGASVEDPRLRQLKDFLRQQGVAV